jgi:hypothetical protein
MTAKEHLALLDKQIAKIDKQAAEHDRQIQVIRDTIRKGSRLLTRSFLESDARMTRIEAALELHITGKASNGKGPNAA